MKQVIEKDNIKSELGFTLFETLVALAILSLTSLVLFQSTSSMLSVSEKASIASDRIVENTIARETFKKIVGGLTPGWPNAENTVFRGNANEFTGLSTSFPSSTDHKIEQVFVSLKVLPDGRNNLVVKSAGTTDLVVDSFMAGTAVFEYMGGDQVFYQNWPPEQLQHFGFAVDEGFQEVPDLPEVIILKIVDTLRHDNVLMMWVASVNGNVKLPYREESTRDDYGL